MKLIVAFLLALSLVAQEKPAAPKDAPKEEKHEVYEAEVITVKTLSGDSFNRLARLLVAFNASFKADDKLRTFVVYAPKNVIAQMRKVVEQLDRPGSEAAIGKNIEMNMAFLKCSTKAVSTPLTLPADLEPVAKQLRVATPYKSIELWDSVPVHMQEGRYTEFNFRLPGALLDDGNSMATAYVKVYPEAVSSKDSGRYVRFSEIKINFRIPYKVGGAGSPITSHFSFAEVGLNTAGDFKEGQKTVLGKVSGVDNDTAIFVVISLKALD